MALIQGSSWLGVGLGVWFFSRLGLGGIFFDVNGTRVIAQLVTDTRLIQATQAYLGQNARPNQPQPQVIRAVQVENYGLVTWLWGEAGGGAVDVGTLTDLGIPMNLAQELLQADARQSREQ